MFVLRNNTNLLFFASPPTKDSVRGHGTMFFDEEGNGPLHTSSVGATPLASFLSKQVKEGIVTRITFEGLSQS